MPASSPKKTPASSEAILKLLAPDGYYTYLGIDKPVAARPLSADGDTNNDNDNSSSPSGVDEEQIKKNYRKLSLRHHPDRPTGDADTFRVLNRAQKVLLNPKLRQQYDLLGMDLDDDEEETDSEHPTNAARNANDAGEDGDDGNSSGSSSIDNIMSQIAAATLATIFQVMVRTVMTGFVSVVLVRFRLLLYPALAFLVFFAYRLHSIASSASSSTRNSASEAASPLLIGLGLILMHRGRTGDNPWSWGFWTGEILVVIMFTYNSLQQYNSPYLAVGVALVAFLLTLWLRGNPWKYATAVALEALLALLAALAFPIMEMILEQILHDKLRRVGDKVRAHAERLEAYYHANSKR
ncbi:hypothetical protein MHU86_1056 [Fragilaria crotonensis]|nr:hypothetical protein MHU86_1056 [Fragilaria crotonensis]